MNLLNKVIMKITREFLSSEPKKSNIFNLSYDTFRGLPVPSDKAFSEYLKDKRIVIVGPAPHLLDSENGNIIDDFDIVVRINKSFPVKKEMQMYLGSKTDIIYHCLYQIEEHGGLVKYKEMSENNVSFIACPYPYKLNPFYKHAKKFEIEYEKSNSSFGKHYVEKDYYINLVKMIGTRYNTGIGAIVDLLRYKIDSLHVMGFSFFETGFIKGYRNLQDSDQMISIDDKSNNWISIDWKNHNQSCQKKLIKLLMENDERLSLDEFGEKVLEQFKDD